MNSFAASTVRTLTFLHNWNLLNSHSSASGSGLSRKSIIRSTIISFKATPPVKSREEKTSD